MSKTAKRETTLMTKLLTVALIFSVPAVWLFIVLWIDEDFDTAWNTFEKFVDDIAGV